MAEIVDFGLQQYKIKMDSRYFENVLSVVAGDTGRRIEVQLLDTNGMVQDTTGLNLRLNAVIAGKATYTDAALVDAATGKYQLDLSNGMFLAPGNWEFQWQITDSAGKKLHSFAFTGNVGKNISEGGSQATNFYLNLEDLKAMQEDLVNGTFNSEALETNIAEKLTDLETQYAPKLTEVTAQLAQTALITNVDHFGAKGDGVTDDHDEIQAAIDSTRPRGGVVQLTPGKAYITNKHLTMYDNVTLVMYGATLILGAHNEHFIVNECFLDTSIRTRNKNINIFGGIVDAGNFSGIGIKNLRCIFHHVDNLKIKDTEFLSKSGKYMVALGDTRNTTINDLEFDCYSDGVHLLGKNYNTIIENISGISGDDLVACTTEDYVDYRFEEGDVDNITIHKVEGFNSTRIVLFGNTKYTIKNIDVDNIRQKGTGDILTIGDGGTQDADVLVDNIKLNNLQGDNPSNRVLLRHRHVGKIELSNIKNTINIARETPNGFVGIDTFIADRCYGQIFGESYITHMNVVILKNIFNRIQLGGKSKTIFIENMDVTNGNQLIYLYGDTKKLIIDKSRLRTTNTGDDSVITYQGIIDEVLFINSDIKGGGDTSQSVLLDSRADGIGFYCKKITFTDCEIGEHKLLYRSMYNGPDVKTELAFINTTVTSTNRLIENVANIDLVLKYSNLTIYKALNSLFRFTSGKKVTVYGDGWNGPNDTLTGSFTAEIFAQDFPVSVDLVRMLPKGRCYNTNPNLPCGVGFLMSDGSKWKNMMSGQTY